MQIIIDIPKEKYDLCKKWKPSERNELQEAVANGISLPKGHGRLIDADAFITKLENASKRQKYKELLIDDLLTVDDVFKAVIESLQNEGLAEGDAPTIIEADKSEPQESEDKE